MFFKEGKNNGITLIALVITIIVLLILSGVTISTLTGDNGLLEQMQKAKNETEVSEEKERIEIAVESAMLNSKNNEIQYDILKNEFKKDKLDGKVIEEEDYIYLGKKANYIINRYGNIKIIDYKGIIYGNTQNTISNGCQQVEYLESTGTQFINSGIKTTNETECYMDCMLLEMSDGQGVIGYNRRSLSNNWSYIRHWTYDIVDYGEKRILINAKTKLNQRYKIYFGNGFLYIPQEGINEVAAKSTKIPSEDIYLFGSYFNDSSVLSQKMRIYELTISENNNVIAHFIPACDSNNNAFMYNTVTKQSFYNDGTGEFKCGSKIFNCLGDKNDNDKYEIPIILKSPDKENRISIILDQPLRRLDNTNDYIDLENKKVVRKIGVNEITGDLYVLDNSIEEVIQMDNIDLDNVFSILVETRIKPSKIE